MFTTCLEVVHSCVLKEAVDNRDHGDVVTDPRNAGPEAAGPTYDLLHLYTSLGGTVQGVDDVLVN